MPSAPAICIVDDEIMYQKALEELLGNHGYKVFSFHSAEEFLAGKARLEFDLVLSDINMSGATGYELCRAVRASEREGRVPIILMTGSDPNEEAMGIEAGADDFIGKPCSTRNLLAKVRSLLEIRANEKETRQKLSAAQGHNDQLNTKLADEERRASRLEQLRQFLSPNLATLLALNDQQNLLKPHRAEVTVLFVDLRRFTEFAERAEPEEVVEVLENYYTAVGNAAIKYKGTLGHLAGDGIMVFFNDPEPLENHMEMAIRMAIEAREALNLQRAVWRERQYDIDFGFGMSVGYATIGGIGFDRFSQYSVIGTVTNLASRLCGQADHGDILISQRSLSRFKDCPCVVEPIGEISLKGIDQPVLVNKITGLKKIPA